jgi:hypothetical protein
VSEVDGTSRLVFACEYCSLNLLTLALFFYASHPGVSFLKGGLSFSFDVKDTHNEKHNP